MKKIIIKVEQKEKSQELEVSLDFEGDFSFIEAMGTLRAAIAELGKQPILKKEKE